MGKKWLYFFIFLLLSIGASIGTLIVFIKTKTIDVASIAQDINCKPSIVIDDGGNELWQFIYEKSYPTSLSQVPQYLIDAFIASEDRDFFSHYGLSLRGIIRSILVNLYYGSKRQGASTITQQLVRLLFFGHKKTFIRKLKEQYYALLLERQCSKQEILQAYLNNVCFGCGIFGVAAASRKFWGIEIQNLSLSQAAALAGIVRSPQAYCPLLYPRSTTKRRDVVLKKMFQQGVISYQEYEQVLAEKLLLSNKQEDSIGLFVREYVRSFMERLVGKDALYSDGYKIKVTINKLMQQKAEALFITHVAQQRELLSLPINGALITMHGSSGGIKALIGGYSFFKSSFDRARNAHRQVGSVLKVLVYVAALQHGKTFADTYVDEPFSLEFGNKLWQPRNHTKIHEGKMTLARALSHSNNIIAIKTLLDIGPESVAELVRACNLCDYVQPYPSLALGCIDATLHDVVGMFNLFAHNGVYVQPHIIDWVKDNNGKIIWQHEKQKKQIVKCYISDQVTKVLTLGMHHCSEQSSLVWPTTIDAIAKTGTTNDSRTCWFLGATPSYTTGIWLGCDDNQPLGQDIYPVDIVFPLWLTVMKKIFHSQKRFIYNDMLQEVLIDPFTGKLPRRKKRHEAITILM
jgi:penicillin-binding protein 1A